LKKKLKIQIGSKKGQTVEEICLIFGVFALILHDLCKIN